MIVLGLTGSIAMGKSTTAKMFREAGIPVWDADVAVHKAYAKGGSAVAPVGSLIPAAVKGGALDREVMRQAIGENPLLLPKIEAIVHPIVAADRGRFIAEADADIIVLDIPLLFEVGADKLCDAVVVVTAPENVQRDRALGRAGMTEDRFAAMLAKQMPDAEKRGRADYLIDTSLGLESARARVAAILEKIADD